MRHERHWVVGLLGLGLLLRVLAVCLFAVTPAQDAGTLEQLGRSLAAGQGYSKFDGVPDTVMPPGVPALVGVVYSVTGVSLLATTLVQALLDLAGCLILWAWIRKRFSPRVAVIALGFAVTSLTAICSTRILRGECIGAVLLAICLALFDLSRDAKRPLLLLALSGLAAGLLTLFRWNFSLLPLALLPLLILRAAKARTKVLGSVVLLTAHFAVLSPWMIRNYELLGEPVLSTQTGITLYSSHFRTVGQPYGNNTKDENTLRANQMPPLEGSRYLVTETVIGLRRDPGRLFTQYPIKIFWLIQPFDWEILSPGKRSFNFTYALISVLAVFTCYDAWHRDRALTCLLLLPFLYLALLSFPFYGSPRFRAPAEMFLAPLAALTIVKFFASLRIRQRQARPASG